MSSTLEQSPVETLQTVEEFPYLFSVDDFYKMVDLDILPEGNRAYLWDGQIYGKPINTTVRAATGMMLLATMCRAMPEGWFCSFNNSFTIGPDKAPIPDMVVIRGQPDDYIDRRPNATDAGLVIEMIDAIPGNDVGRKLDAYASAGIPACWLINPEARLIHINELPLPSQGRYISTANARRGESFPLLLDRSQVCLIAASDLLPAR